MSKIRICIDAGHGYDTPGKRTPLMPQELDYNKDGTIDIKKETTMREHVANVGVAMFLTRDLERCGFEVHKSGFDDSNAADDKEILLTERQLAIKQAGCDYTVSIHFNAYGDGTSFNDANGIGVYIHNNYPKDSKIFAEKVLNQLVQGTKQKNRGVSAASLAMCNCMKMKTKASILIECAFMTNLKEAVNMMGNDDYWEETSVEIAKGICNYTGVIYIEEEDEFQVIVCKVQVGAFSHILNANALVEKLRNAGFSEAFMYTTFVGGKLLYRVQIGPDISKTKAKKLLVKVKAAGFVQAFIQ